MSLDASLSTIEAAADAGDPEAMYELGNRHAYGQGVPINIRTALNLWMSAALHNHADALYRIGLCYSLGTCVPRDTDTAIEMWLKAAAGGSRDAMHMLGVFHLHGDGVAKNMPKAVMWLLLAGSHSEDEADDTLYELNKCITDAERRPKPCSPASRSAPRAPPRCCKSTPGRANMWCPARPAPRWCWAT